MDILCSTDMRICYLAAKARTDFIKVEEKKPTQRNKSCTAFITSTPTYCW